MLFIEFGFVYSLTQELTNFFCKAPESIYFCGPRSLTATVQPCYNAKVAIGNP